MRRLLGITFLAAQLIWVLIVHVTGMQSRYFCWAPNDYVVMYQIQVTEHGHPLTAAEITARYDLDATGEFEDPVQRLEDIIRQYEQTYGRGDGAHVTLTYSLNGHAQEVWTWA
jgi:hypothetical protein